MITELKTISDTLREAPKKKPSISIDNLLDELQNFMEKPKAESSEPYGIPGPFNISELEYVQE